MYKSICKKSLAVLLTVLMLLSVISSLSVTSFAASTELPEDAAKEPVGDTLFSDQIPDFYDNGSGGLRNALGTIFGTTEEGTITKVRVYTSAQEGGEHLVSIWNYDTKTLLTEEIYSWDITAGYEGWREFTLPKPVTVVPDVKYAVSVTAGPDCIYMAKIDGVKNPISSEYLYTVTNSGLYSSNAYASTYSMPDVQSPANFMRDVEFIPKEAPVQSETVSIFTDQIPKLLDNGGGSRNALGTLFATTKAGDITKVRIYTSAQEKGEHLVSIWNYDTNTMLTEQIYTWNITEGYEGWQEFTLPKSVAIEPDVNYVVSVTTGPDCLYMAEVGTLAGSITNECLYTIANGGLYSSNSYAATYAMPDARTSANFFRDVVFVPEKTAEPILPDDVAGEPIGDILFPNQIPDFYDNGSGGMRNALGTKFGTTKTGLITKVRLYTSAQECGEHLVSIWNYDTKALLTEEIYSWDITAGYEGWREFALPTPVSIEPDTTYVVSVTTGADCIYIAEVDGLKTSISSEYLYTIENGGLYSSNSYAATYAMPDAQSTANFFRDVEFLPFDGEFDVKVTEFGAKGDGITNDRKAIQTAIDTASAVGGGTVRLDAGKTFISGNIIIRDNVNFVLEEGSILRQSANPDDFVNPLKNYEPFQLTFGLYLDLSIEWNAAAFYNFPFILVSEGTENVKISGSGAIEMDKGTDEKGEITMQVIGLFRAENFEISDITIREYHSYCIMAVSCSDGLFKNITIDNSQGTTGGTDGINLTSCKNIRVTECNLNTGDDGIYVLSSCNDPRTRNLWYNLSDPLTPSNIEIDNNHCEVTWNETKAFCFIMWGEEIADQRLADVNNIYVHDNYFETAGAWTGHWNKQTGKFEYSGKCNPMKNIRFENNTFGSIQSSFYTLPVSDFISINNKLSDGSAVDFDSMKNMKNTDFSKYDTYWVSREGGSSGWNEAGFGYIDNLDKADAALYQGINFTADTDYKFTANVKSSGDPVRLFVKDQITGELIASKEFTNTDWQTVELEFSVPKTGDYHIGIERGNATKGYGCIDDASCAVYSGPPEDAAKEPVGDTLFPDQIPDFYDNGSGGLRNALGTIFGTTKTGTITKVRVYTSAQEGGEHLVSIWNYDTKTLLTEEIYSWNITAGYEGWREFTLPKPVTVVPDVKYAVSVTAGPDCIYMAKIDGVKNPISSEYLYTVTNSGLYSSNAYASTYSMPDVQSPANFMRDVEFVPSVQLNAEPWGTSEEDRFTPQNKAEQDAWWNETGSLREGSSLLNNIWNLRENSALNHHIVSRLEGEGESATLWYDVYGRLTFDIDLDDKAESFTMLSGLGIYSHCTVLAQKPDDDNWYIVGRIYDGLPAGQTVFSNDDAGLTEADIQNTFKYLLGYNNPEKQLRIQLIPDNEYGVKPSYNDGKISVSNISYTVELGDGVIDSSEYTVPMPYKEEDYPAKSKYLLGDSNEDGKIDILDLIKMKNALLNKEEYNKVMDINKDKALSSLDFTELKKNIWNDSPYEYITNEIKVLSIGNSFSQDSHAYLYKLAKANGVELKTTNLFIGGCSLETHWNNAKENNALYHVEINGIDSQRLTSISDALRSDDWDVITIQQVSGLSGIYDTYEPYLSSLIEMIKEERPNAEIYFHQTWAYDIGSNHVDFPRYNSDQKQMYDSIIEASEKAAEENNIDLIRTGTVIQALRDTVPEFDLANGGISLCRDGFHLSYDYGRYAAAATWLRTLTGESIKTEEFENLDKNLLAKITKVVNELEF